MILSWSVSILPGPRDLMTTIPQVSLVIPVYNQVHYTKQCVASIARWTDVPYELVIVDNASGSP